MPTIPLPPKPRNSSAANSMATSTTPGVYAHLDKLSAEYNHAVKEEVRRQTHEAKWWKEQANNRDEEISTLQQSVQGRDRALQQAGQQRDALERQANDFRVTSNDLLADRGQTVEQLRREKAELDKKVGELEQQHAAKVAELGQATKQLLEQEHAAKAVEEVCRLRVEKEAIEKELATEREVTKGLRACLAESQKRVDLLEEEANAHTDKQSTLQEDLTRLRESGRLMESQLAETKNSMERLHADKKGAENGHVEESKAHKRTREKHDKEREAAKELKRWSDERRKRVEELEPEVEELRAKLTSEREASTRTNSQCANLQIKLKSAETQLEAMKQQCAVYEETMGRVISSVAGLANPALNLSTSRHTPPQTAQNDADSGLVGRPPITPLSPDPNMAPPSAPASQVSLNRPENPASGPWRRYSESTRRDGSQDRNERRGTKRMLSLDSRDKSPPCGPKAWRSGRDVYRP